MADADLKKLLNSLQKEMAKLGDQNEVILNKVGNLEMFYGVNAQQIRFVRDQQSVMNKKLDSLSETVNEHTEILKNHTESLITIENTVGSYKDSYQENKKNIERLDTRLNTVEDELAINPPEELKVPHFSAD